MNKQLYEILEKYSVGEEDAQYILDLFPEVIKSVLLENERSSKDGNQILYYYTEGKNDCLDKIKQKAKDLYDITI